MYIQTCCAAASKNIIVLSQDIWPIKDLTLEKAQQHFRFLVKPGIKWNTSLPSVVWKSCLFNYLFSAQLQRCSLASSCRSDYRSVIALQCICYSPDNHFNVSFWFCTHPLPKWGSLVQGLEISPGTFWSAIRYWSLTQRNKTLITMGPSMLQKISAFSALVLIQTEKEIKGNFNLCLFRESKIPAKNLSLKSDKIDASCEPCIWDIHVKKQNHKSQTLQKKRVTMSPLIFPIFPITWCHKPS